MSLFRNRRDRKPQAPTPAARRRAALRSRPSVEAVEGRQLLSTFAFNVTTNVDNGDNSSPTPNSLRWAIVQADRVGTENSAEIDFHLPTTVPPTIAPQAALPAVTAPTFLNGPTQNGAPLLRLDGTQAGAGAVGLQFVGAGASGSRVVGLQVTGFSGGGVLASGATHVQLDQDWVGIATANFGEGNRLVTGANCAFGVEFAGGASFGAVTNSTVSANQYNGIVITGHSNNTVVSNTHIGTDPTGTVATTASGGSSFGNGVLGGGGSGVVINNGSSYSSIDHDVISNNRDYGVLVTDPNTSYNYITNSEIGTDSTGSAALPNHFGAAVTNGASYNTIGFAGSGDVISGNSWDGVQLLGQGTVDNTVQGDRIGTNAAGGSQTPNTGSGVAIAQGASFNTVDSDLLSGNSQEGVYISDANTAWNTVSNSTIGADVSGKSSVPNNGGVLVQGGTRNNTVSHDLISGNSLAGVWISASSGNLITGSTIGLNSLGTAAVPNGVGVELLNGASGNTLSNSTISGNVSDGVQLLGGASGNHVQADRIGTDPLGAVARGNLGNGVAIAQGANNNTIGGPDASYRDVISGNAQNGVYVSDPGTNSDTIQYDYIGTDLSGQNPVSNGRNGVLIQGGAAWNNVYNDLISANLADGVLVTGGNTHDNTVSGDWIGLDGSGTRALKAVGLAYSNVAGVQVSGSAYNTSVGSSVISGNQTGVSLDFGATSNWVVYDKIGTDVAGTGNVGNIADGVILDAVSNNLIGYDTIAYNGDVGILGEVGATADNNSLVSANIFANRTGTTDFD